jgi:TM2 domain-containing membrane protein YozV
MILARLLAMRRFLAVLLTWFLPGLGHLVAGRPGKAAYFFVLLGGTYFIGLALGGFRIVSFDRHPFFTSVFLLQLAPTLTTLELTEGLRITEEILTVELGCLFAATAALLNVLVMIDADGIVASSRPGSPGEVS